MAKPYELFVLNTLLAIVVGVVAGVVWLIGRHNGLEVVGSIAFAVAIVICWLPGLANIYAMLGTDAFESLGERLSVGIGGFGKLLVGVGVVLPFTVAPHRAIWMTPLALGGLIWWKSYFYRANRRDMRIIESVRGRTDDGE